MHESLAGRVLFRTVAPTVGVISLAALMASPAWAQRGQARGGGAPPPPPMHMSMPPMRMSPPPMMSRPAPMPRQAPMPRPAPMPRTQPPPMRAPVQPTPSRRAPSSSGSALPSSMPTGSTLSSPTYSPVPPEARRRPAYTPSSPKELHDQAMYIKSLQGRPTPFVTNYANYNYGWGYGAFGFGADPFLFGAFGCGGVWDCYCPQPYGFFYFPTNCFYLYPSALMFSSFGYSPFGLSYFPGTMGLDWFGSGMYFGNQCVLCDPSLVDALTLAYGTNDTAATSLQTSVLISNGVLPGLTSLPSAAASAGDNGSGGAESSPGGDGYLGATGGPQGSASASGSASLPSGQPITLVFRSGASTQAIQYWVSNDGRLSYVTSDGVKHVVPLSQLDLAATSKANGQNGVQFLPPASSPEPAQPH